jgi:hypothetical protein
MSLTASLNAMEKSLTPAGNRTQAVQAVARRYSGLSYPGSWTDTKQIKFVQQLLMQIHRTTMNQNAFMGYQNKTWGDGRTDMASHLCATSFHLVHWT